MLQAIGSARFADTLLELVRKEFGVVELAAWTLNAGRPKSLLVASRLAGARERAIAWCDRFHRQDPVFASMSAAPAGRIVSTCSRVSTTPGCDYRALFHFGAGLDELISIAFRAERLVVLHLYRPRGAALNEEASGRLNGLALTLMAALRAHVDAECRTGPLPETTIPPLTMVEEMLRKVRPDLTERETEVCARTVIGTTALGISLDLGISVSTVTTYRRRAYTRMGICSAYELLGSLISSSDSRILEEFTPARAA